MQIHQIGKYRLKQENLKSNLKILCQKRLYQKELANTANISVMTYSQYESGERIPNVCIAQQFVKALNVSIEELFPLSNGY